MKKFFIHLSSCLMLLTVSLTVQAQQNPGLPVIDHNGRNCYFYTLKGNESIFGLLSRFGWEEDVFMSYNPDAANLKKGGIVYYPVEQDDSAETAGTGLQLPPLQEAPVVTPVAVPQGAVADPPFVYTLTDSDNLYTLARRYHTSVKQIFGDNPGLEEYKLKAGDRLLITPGIPGANMEQVSIKEKRVTGTRSYKVAAGDTWERIAAEARVPLDLLLSVNNSRELPNKGKKINIPLVADTIVVHTREYIDPREETPADRWRIYNEVHSLPLSLPLDVTLLTGTTADSKKRDLEFVRGFLLGLDAIKGAGYPVRLHVREADPASLSVKSLGNDSVIAASRLILATYDKDFPAALSQFADNGTRTLINVFDAKSDLYEKSPYTIQLLPPSSEFYNDCADFLLASKGDSKFIFVAEDEADGECISLILLERLIREGKSYETIPSYADLASYPFTDWNSYVIVSDLNKRADIVKLADDIEAIIDRSPATQISVVGRPTWVVYADGLKDKLQKADTYIPSRFYLDPADPAVQTFEKDYTDTFGGAPLKSYPAYAAMGYDTARYFLPAIIGNQGDLNKAVSGTDSLQLDFNLTRPELWSGMLGGNVYLLHFTPYNTVDKIRL